MSPGRLDDDTFTVTSNSLLKYVDKNKALDWLKKGYATYINNEKVQNFLLHHSALIAGASAKSEPLSAAKIIKNFENKKISDKIIREQREIFAEFDKTDNKC